MRNSFEVKIDSRGDWIGIGFCEKNSQLKLIGGSTLGSQSGLVNGSFFCQDATSLGMYL
jgi:hypothetical protein